MPLPDLWCEIAKRLHGTEALDGCLHLTPDATRVLARASRLAMEAGAEQVGPEHLLSALFREPGTVAQDVLARFRVPGLPFADQGTDAVRSRQADPERGAPYTDRAARALEYAALEGYEPEGTVVTSAHVLLGLMRQEGSTVPPVLTSCGITLAMVRWETRHLLAAIRGTGARP